MARALGSYPSCPRFESRCRYHFTKDRTTRPFHIERPGGQAVKTPPFHGGNTGSSPVRVTTLFIAVSIWRHSSAGRASASHAEGHRFEFCCLHHLRTSHRNVWCSCFLGGCASFSATTRIGISSSSSLFCSFSPKLPPRSAYPVPIMK